MLLLTLELSTCKCSLTNVTARSDFAVIVSGWGFVVVSSLMMFFVSMKNKIELNSRMKNSFYLIFVLLWCFPLKNVWEKSELKCNWGIELRRSQGVWSWGSIVRLSSLNRRSLLLIVIGDVISVIVSVFVSLDIDEVRLRDFDRSFVDDFNECRDRGKRSRWESVLCKGLVGDSVISTRFV